MKDVLLEAYFKVTFCFGKFSSHLLERELKLSSVEQELEKHLGVVLGVVEHLIFELTQPLVVRVVGCETEHGSVYKMLFIYIGFIFFPIRCLPGVFQPFEFLHFFFRLKPPNSV